MPKKPAVPAKQPDSYKKWITRLLIALVAIIFSFGVYLFFLSFLPKIDSQPVVVEKKDDLEDRVAKLRQEMAGAVQTKIDARHNQTDQKITELGVRMDSGFAEIKKQIAQNCETKNSTYKKVSAIKPTVRSAPTKSKPATQPNNWVTKEEFRNGLDSLRTDWNRETQNFGSRLTTLENTGRTNIQSSLGVRSGLGRIVHHTDSSQTPVQNSAHPWM